MTGHAPQSEPVVGVRLLLATIVVWMAAFGNGLSGAAAAGSPPAGAPPVLTAAPRADDPVHPKEYWRAIAENRFAVPDGEDPFDLLVDLFRNLGSPDSVLRDDYAYGITYQWVARQRLLEPEDCLVLMEQLVTNLEEGIGEQNTDTVLLRSFSVLNLSIFASWDLQSPFLEAEDFAGLLDAALIYLEEERDVRGHDPRMGWLHSTAHTADLIRFLARSPHLQTADQERIFQGIARRTATAGVVYTHGEDDRMAQALLSLCARDDFEPGLVEGFVTTLRDGSRRRPGAPNFDPAQHAARQNAVQLARALYVMLAREEEPPEPRRVARDTLLEALGQL